LARLAKRTTEQDPEKGSSPPEIVAERISVDDVPKRPIGRYIIGLALIAILAIVSTALTSALLSRQQADAIVVSEAANQILRGQKIGELGYQIIDAETPEARASAISEMRVLLTVTETMHLGLRFGDDTRGLPGDNSLQVAKLLEEVDPTFHELMIAGVDVLERAETGTRLPRGPVTGLEVVSQDYKTGMSSVVSQYQKEAEARVTSLKSTQYVLLTITIMLIIFEGLFLFRPAVKEFRKEWQQKTVEHQSAREDDQRKLSYLARFDPLTGLINRFLFGDRLQSAIARARRDGGLVSLMFLDLDEFKAINDRYGHATGDGLLKEVAKRLVDSVRESDSVARLGGDEFTVVLEGNHRVEDAGNVATKILHALAEPYTVGAHELYVTASIGIALYPVDGQSAHDLLRDADIAMYSAKAAGKNTYQYFTPELREQTTERLHLIDGLRRAIEARHELSLVYQPKVDIRNGQMIGVEALVRWHHPELGLVLPDRFVPVAEQTDLILPIGEWVIGEACRQMKSWISSGMDFTVSVNVSSRQLRHGDLVVTVADALEESGLEPHYLEIELTEGTLVEDTELAARTLERLRTMGVQVSIDDFGTGYSSLSYLKRLPIDRLKIDRTFVRDITVNEDSAALSAAIVGLAKSLRLDVVAEGVETVEQLRVLEDLGCHIVQGFYFSRPMKPDKMRTFVDEGLKAVLADAARATPSLRKSAG